MEKLGGVAKRVGTRSDNLRRFFFWFTDCQAGWKSGKIRIAASHNAEYTRANRIKRGIFSRARSRDIAPDAAPRLPRAMAWPGRQYPCGFQGNTLNRLQLQFFAALTMQKNKHRLALVVPILSRRLKNLNNRFELAFMMIGERVEVIE